MTVLGLTGAIGMGKSTVLRMFEKLGAAGFDADKAAHDILSNNKKLMRLFPESVENGAINRKKLAAKIAKNPADIATLEEIIHPLVFKACRAFIEQNKNAKLVVLDIPLLFEAGFDVLCDRTVTVSARAGVQKERVMKRKHMTQEKLRALQKRQFSDKEKRARADFVIKTDTSLAGTRKQVKTLWENLLCAK